MHAPNGNARSDAQPIARRMRMSIGAALAWQGGSVGVLAAVLLATGRPLASLACIAGGAISMLPNLWFALRVLALPASLDAGRRVGQLYLAEAIKLVLCGVMFALVFSRLRSLPPAWVMAGFLLAHPVYLVALAWLQRERQEAGVGRGATGPGRADQNEQASGHDGRS
jgi:F0F1-type ATP synthase assembly protein I